MRENRLLTLLFLLLSIFSYAQIKGIVKDSISGKAIPFVNIWVENEEIGTISEADGTFSLNISKEKRLVFSSLGYETKKTSFKNETILLKPKVFELKEVVIEQPKLTKEIEVGNYESNGFRVRFGYKNSAVFFKPNKEMITHPFLKELKFHTKSDIENAKIRIKILSLKSDDSPGESLLEEEIIVTVKKGKNKNIVDLSVYRFKIPNEGFFVFFEKLLIEDNKYHSEFSYKDRLGKKTTRKTTSIEPELCYIPEENEIVWELNYNGNWTKSKKYMVKNPEYFENFLMKKYHNKYLMPSMMITLTN